MSAQRTIAYKELANELREMILSDRLGPDRRLPTEAQLVQKHGVSRQTVRRAFQELGADGLVSRVPGRGSFAVPRPRDGAYARSFVTIEDLVALSTDTIMKVLIPMRSISDAAISNALGLDEAAPLAQTRIVRLFDGEAFCVTDATFPMDIARRLETEAPGEPNETSTYVSTLDKVLDGGIAGAKQEFAAAFAPEDEVAELLDSQTTPILVVTRIYYDTMGRFVEHATSYYSPHRYKYSLNLRR